MFPAQIGLETNKTDHRKKWVSANDSSFLMPVP